LIELATVIVSYRSREPLLECLAALAADVAAIPHETVVVDNDPVDDTLDAAARAFPVCAASPTARTSATRAAVNQGLAATSAEFVLVMNPDCVPEPGN
jgi:GT2 family glycosyltransferase